MHESPCIVESTSGATLVTESSLENSTCASDDLSESNKTLTGDEGLFLLTNFGTLSESRADPPNADSLNCTESEQIYLYDFYVLVEFKFLVLFQPLLIFIVLLLKNIASLLKYITLNLRSFFNIIFKKFLCWLQK